MAKEKIKHRNGQILGVEKRKCNVCNKITDHNVVYFFAKRLGWTWNEVIGVNLTQDPHIGYIAYICSECKTSTMAEDQKDLKTKYDWSSFYGFRGIPKQKIEFKVWKK